MSSRIGLLARLSVLTGAALLMSAGMAQAGSIKVLHRFGDTGKSPSHYSLGANPYAELLQASDGNFYGTTLYGGTGLCPNTGEGGYTGCGTIFRMTPTGTVTTLYSFPYDTTTGIAPNGAYPTAGLIQAKDGNLYGVAQQGGSPAAYECNGPGCGTVFRISLTGAFTLLHKFCGGNSPTGCTTVEGGQPEGHLVQAADGLLYGTTQQGGIGNQGTVFSISTGGALQTLHFFQQDSRTDGNAPYAPLVVGPDGKTLYGTTAFGGDNGGGTIFSLKAGVLTVLHSFDSLSDGDPNASFAPTAALIFGADGKLYGTTTGGDGGTLFSMATNGSGFTVAHAFTGGGGFGGNDTVTPLVLGTDGWMYGTELEGSLTCNCGSDGAIFKFDPKTGVLKGVAAFTTGTGAQSRGGLIEGTDGFLYGTTSLYGGSNHRGPDLGAVVRLMPALKQ
jgi:uncharacterized repeat protein (TIGR03803 family)